MVERIVKVTSTGLGVGFSPYAPGTLGTAVGIPVYLFFSYFPWPIYLLCLLSLFILAVYTSQRAEVIFNEKDSSRIVIDEIVGFQCTMFLVTPTIMHIFLGFIFFRFFDIVKPFPIRVCERKLPGGYGVVGDDVVAGIYGNVMLLLLVRFWGI